MRRVDYDTEQYQDYARGRALTQRQTKVWVDACQRPVVTARRRSADVPGGGHEMCSLAAMGSAR